MRGIAVPWEAIFLTFLTLLWREASISINWSKWLNICPTRSWPWEDAFHKLLCSGLLNLPFGNHSEKVSLSENQTKNQSWKQYGRQTWARWKWELERSTCRVCLCWKTPTPTIFYLAPHLNNRKQHNHIKNLKVTNMSSCSVRAEDFPVKFWSSEKVLRLDWQFLHRAR